MCRNAHRPYGPHDPSQWPFLVERPSLLRSQSDDLGAKLSPTESPVISAPKAVESFEELAEQYSTLFLDAYGVLKNSSGLLPGILPLLRRLQQKGKRIFVLTNDASKSPSEMAKSYEHPEYGELLSAEHIICSGGLAQLYLQEHLKPGKVAYFGKPSAAHFIVQAGHEPLAIDHCNTNDRVDAIAFLDDEGFDWSRSLNVAVNLLRRRNVPVLVANSDFLYPTTERDVGIAVGAIAGMLETLVARQFLRFGKPHPAIFARAFDVAAQDSQGLSKSDVLMVGDTLRTDICGANQFGIDTMLVLSGNTQLVGNNLSEQASGLNRSAEHCPRYLCPSVVSN